MKTIPVYKIILEFLIWWFRGYVNDYCVSFYVVVLLSLRLVFCNPHGSILRPLDNLGFNLMVGMFNWIIVMWWPWAIFKWDYSIFMEQVSILWIYVIRLWILNNEKRFDLWTKEWSRYSLRSLFMMMIILMECFCNYIVFKYVDLGRSLLVYLS